MAFADDVAVVAAAHNAELIEQLVNPVLTDIVDWMSTNGLRLAPEKTGPDEETSLSGPRIVYCRISTFQ